MGRGEWNLVLRSGQPLVVRHAAASDAAALLAHVDTVCEETNFLSFGPGERTCTVEQQAQILSEHERSATQIQLLALVEGPPDRADELRAAAVYGRNWRGAKEPPGDTPNAAALVVGALAYTTSDRPRLRHSGELGMTVLNACRGLGVGTHLLECLLKWARSGGDVRKLNLRVRTDNDRAIALYKRLGFQIEGTISCDFCVAGVDYNHHWMGLRL